jgi:phage regulator Rha-like protein
MASQEVAELTGKDHKNVLRDIDSLLKTLGSEFCPVFSIYYECPPENGYLPKTHKLTGKRHDHVLRDIDNLLKSLTPDLVACFSMSYEGPPGNGYLPKTHNRWGLPLDSPCR